MTIILTIQVQDGVVLASDSAMAHRGHVYFQAEKVVQLAKGLPVGVLICGDGAVGATSIVNLLSDFEHRVQQRDHRFHIERNRYELRQVASDLAAFIEEAADAASAPVTTSLVVSGYSGDDDLPQTWAIQIRDGKLQDLSIIWDRNDYGVNWDGQGLCIHRLLMDLALPERRTGAMDDARAFKAPLPDEDAIDIDSPTIVTPGMPILDAVEVARFLMETSVAFESYRADRNSRTIGGPIDIAVITAHKGFRWVQRKRPYTGRRSPGARV